MLSDIKRMKSGGILKWHKENPRQYGSRQFQIAKPVAYLLGNGVKRII
jgi:hypothetical protein